MAANIGSVKKVGKPKSRENPSPDALHTEKEGKNVYLVSKHGHCYDRRVLKKFQKVSTTWEI